MCRSYAEGYRRCELANQRWSAKRRSRTKKALAAAAKAAQASAGTTAVTEAAEALASGSTRRVVLPPMATAGSVFVSDGEKLRRSLTRGSVLHVVRVERRDAAGAWVEVEHPMSGREEIVAQVNGAHVTLESGDAFSTGDAVDYTDGLVLVEEGQQRTTWRLDAVRTAERTVDGFGGLDDGGAKRVGVARDGLAVALGQLEELVDGKPLADGWAFMDRLAELNGRVNDAARVLDGEQRDLRGLSETGWRETADIVDPGVVAERLRVTELAHAAARYEEIRAGRRLEVAKRAAASGDVDARKALARAEALIPEIHELVGALGRELTMWRSRKARAEAAIGAGEGLAA